jgi:hypothetical protein
VFNHVSTYPHPWPNGDKAIPEQIVEEKEEKEEKVKGSGPVVWCNRCSRRHHRRDCNLEFGVFVSKAGNMVPCWRNVPQVEVETA